ncbi:hypothetical protein CLOSTHATH_03871, partial [Hungatella hathewayi DSM 13479]
MVKNNTLNTRGDREKENIMEKILVAEGLIKQYITKGHTTNALNGIGFEVCRGEYVG